MAEKQKSPVELLAEKLTVSLVDKVTTKAKSRFITIDGDEQRQLREFLAPDVVKALQKVITAHPELASKPSEERNKNLAHLLNEEMFPDGKTPNKDVYPGAVKALDLLAKESKIFDVKAAVITATPKVLEEALGKKEVRSLLENALNYQEGQGTAPQTSSWKQEIDRVAQGLNGALAEIGKITGMGLSSQGVSIAATSLPRPAVLSGVSQERSLT